MLTTILTIWTSDDGRYGTYQELFDSVKAGRQCLNLDEKEAIEISAEETEPPADPGWALYAIFEPGGERLYVGNIDKRDASPELVDIIETIFGAEKWVLDVASDAHVK